VVSGIKRFLYFYTTEVQRRNRCVQLLFLSSISLVICCQSETLCLDRQHEPLLQLHRLPKLSENSFPCRSAWHLLLRIVDIKSAELLQCSSQTGDWICAFIFKFIREQLKPGTDEVRKGVKKQNMGIMKNIFEMLY